MSCEQIQAGEAYHLSIPMAVTLDGRERAYQTTVDMDQKQIEMNLNPPGRSDSILIPNSISFED